MGQSLVELAIALPLLLILLTGLAEAGFILNHYLSLLDATREAARRASNFNPWLQDINGAYVDANGDTLPDDDPDYYDAIDDIVVNNLQPQDAQDTSRKIMLDPALDDIVIVVFDVNHGVVTRYPVAGDYHWAANGLHASQVDNTDIFSQLDAAAPNTAIVVVEVFYTYHPLLSYFLRSPITLHAHSMMPMPPISTVWQPGPTAPFAFIDPFIVREGSK